MIATYKASLDRDNRVNWLDAAPKPNFEKASVLVLFLNDGTGGHAHPAVSPPRVDRTKVHPELKPIMIKPGALLPTEAEWHNGK